MATVASASRHRRGGRRLGLTYAGLSALLVLALLPALHPPRPPLPPVAAFAPVAQQNITKPPPDQASTAGKGANQNGNGEAGGGSGTPTPAPTPTPTPNANGLGASNSKEGTSVPRTLDCVDGPGGPRQIEDTQSPPCVPYWKGDNGGTTWKGVDANTIRIGVGETQRETPLWNKFFNDRFQFYGRQIQLVEVKCGGDSASPEATMKQRARAVAAENNVFAVLGCNDAGGREKYFFDELARNGIMSVTARPDLRSEADYQRAAPYEWNYYPSYDVDEHNMAAQACKLRDQQPPAYTPPSLAGKRSFGVVYTSYPDSASIDLHYLLDDLNACGVAVARKDILPVDYVAGTADTGYQNRSTTSTQQAQQAIAQLATDGITTVLFISHAASTVQVLQQADTAGYHPEWMMGYFSYNTAWGSGVQPADQWSHALGFDYQNKLVTAPNNPWYWAVMQEDPNYPWPYAPASYNGWFWYEMELMLASGLQMAGPHLTPETFQAGLWKTHFPNPPSAYFEGTVGFNSDHTFVKDRVLVWFSPGTTGPWAQQGVWCYVNHGRRYTDATVPGGYPYFSGQCEA